MLRVLPSNELGQLDVGVAGKDLDAVGGHCCCTECIEWGSWVAGEGW